MPLTEAELLDLQADAMADDVEIDLEKMSLWTAEQATAYFESGGTEELDSFMITSLLAPPGVREMAAGDTFRKLGITPLLRMAAHVHRSVGGRSVKFSPLAGTLISSKR